MDYQLRIVVEKVAIETDTVVQRDTLEVEKKNGYQSSDFFAVFSDHKLNL